MDRFDISIEFQKTGMCILIRLTLVIASLADGIGSGKVINQVFVFLMLLILVT